MTVTRGRPPLSIARAHLAPSLARVEGVEQPQRADGLPAHHFGALLKARAELAQLLLVTAARCHSSSDASSADRAAALATVRALLAAAYAEIAAP